MATKKEELSFSGKIKKVLTSPNEFFQSVKSEDGIKSAFIYYLVLLSFSTLMTLLLNYILFKNIDYIPMFNWMSGILIIFIGTGIFHIFALLAKGKGGYSNTFKAMAYTNTPISLFGWAIPYIASLFTLSSVWSLQFISVSIIVLISLIVLHIWQFYLTFKGYKILHGLSTRRAFFAVLIPIMIMIAIIIIGLKYAYPYPDIPAETATRVGSAQLNETLSWMQQRIGIDDASGTVLKLRNMGTNAVITDRITVYLGNAYISCLWDSTSIRPNEVVSCTLPEPCSGKKVKIIAPGNSDEVFCS